MTEELVTLETAKLLKEKGFNERTLFAYKNNGNLYQDFNRIRLSYNSLPVPELCENFCACESDNPCYKCGTAVYLTSAPNQSFAQKWLREIRGVYVYVEPVIGKRWKLSFCDFNVPTEESDWMENEINKGNGYKVYDTYEEALEAGIQEVLKLI